MSKRYHINYDYNFQGSSINKIKVNKRSEIPRNTIKLRNYQKISDRINNKDNFYYSIEKKSKTQKNKIPTSLNKKNIKKPLEINTYNVVGYTNRDTYKKTINTYNNENKDQEFNIFEELQKNKYLRPMLGSSNIENKLFKCQIEKNISISSLKKYFSNNLEFSLEKYKSPQKRNNDISCENKSNEYNLNNRTAMERFNLNLNNNNSNNNSFAHHNEHYYNDESFKLNSNNNNLMKQPLQTKRTKYIINNIKKRQQKKKYFYSEERKEKQDNETNNNEETKDDINIIYYKNVIGVNNPDINNSPVKIRNTTINVNDVYISKNNLKQIIPKKSKKNIKNNKNNSMFLPNNKKTIEEFKIIIDKFFNNYMNKNCEIFMKNLKNYKKSKIYFKKKNKTFIKKRLTLNKIVSNNDNKNNIIYNNKNKLTTDTSTNFNINNKSFSNEIKSSSISNNFISNLFINNNNNNNKLNTQSSSSLITEQRHKNYSQSHTSSLNKYQEKTIKAKIKAKPISKHKKMTPRNTGGSPQKLQGFVYKKKNLNNENTRINNFYSNYNNNKYLSFFDNNNKKKGKIIDIDINLGKPVNIINDHSPLEDFFFFKNQPFLNKLNTISSKFMIKNNKKNKAKSNSKKKIKPPLILKKFEEEDDDDYFNSIYNNNYQAYSTLKRTKKDQDNNEIMNLEFSNKLNKINIKNIFKEDNLLSNNIENINNQQKEKEKEEIIRDDNYIIRINSIAFIDNKNRDSNYEDLVIGKNIEVSLLNNNKKKDDFMLNKNDYKKKVNKLYINCTKFLVKLINRIIKNKIFIILKK